MEFFVGLLTGIIVGAYCWDKLVTEKVRYELRVHQEALVEMCKNVKELF